MATKNTCKQTCERAKTLGSSTEKPKSEHSSLEQPQQLLLSPSDFVTAILFMKIYHCPDNSIPVKYYYTPKVTSTDLKWRFLFELLVRARYVVWAEQKV